MNKKLKLKSAILQSVALLLFFALAFTATAASTGLIGNPDKVTEQGNNSPFDQILRPTTSQGATTTAPSTSGGADDPPSTNENNPSVPAGWVTNLNNAFNTGLIEGYTDDRSKISLSQRVELHHRLTASISAATDAMTPVTYQSFSADAYMLAKRLTLEKEFISGTEIITKYSKDYNTKDAGFYTVATPYLIGRKTVQPYMGYLLISRVEVRQVAITTTTQKPEVIVPITTTTQQPVITEKPVNTTTAAPTTATTTTKAPTPETTPATKPETTPATTPETTPVTKPATTPETKPETTPATTPVTVPATQPVVEPEVQPEVTTAPTTAGQETSANTPTVEPEITAQEGAETTTAVTVPTTEPASQPSMASAGEAGDGSDGEVRYETKEVTVLALYDRKGNLLVEDLGTKKPYFARDYSNFPVFTDDAGKLYAFNGKTFKEIGKGDLRQNLFYDYPAIPLGLYKGVYEAHYSSSLGGYHFINYKNKKSIYSSNYFRAFNYSEEGLAVVITATDNFLQIINRSKGQMIKPGKQYTFYVDPTTGKKLYGKDFFYLPDTLGIESMGCAGFDHGYLRLRIRTYSMMSDSYGRTIQDKDFLINTKGEKFPIPDGYTIAGYSEGILLLERNGLYGYYSVEGEWITQPIYSYARPFIQGLAVLGAEDGTMGMIDKEGNIVLPFAFSYVSDISTGVIVTYCEGIGFETYELVKKPTE